MAPLLSVAFLASCNPQPADVKHTLTFSGTNCDLYLDEEGKTKYTATEFEAGYVFSGYIIANEGYALPEEVVFTSGDQPYKDDTATYNAESGALSVKMNADIKVEAVTEEAIDYTVTKEEFDKALGFEGITYLQMGSYGDIPGVFTSDVINKYSPNIYYSKSIVTSQAGENYTEKYVYKISDSVYKSISRGSSTETWGDWVDDTAGSFQTPGNVGQNLLGMLATLGFEFDPTKFDAETKSYVIPFDDGSGDIVNLIFKFENKKIIYFDLGGQGEYTFSYDEVTPELPIPAPTL